MNILVTGAAGFVGYSLCQKILKNKNIKVYGVDNLNNYYSPKLKLQRIKNLKLYKKFTFIKSDLNETEKIIRKIKKISFEYIFHFAAQAGVRYVEINPESYLNSNISGFANILQIAKKINPKRFIFASSSSVYGDSDKYPCKETDQLRPINLYAVTKKMNEELAQSYLQDTSIKITCLRLFTIYGEWGRPDMLIIKFLNSAKNNKCFEVNNFGNYFRDFTYIKDAIRLIEKVSFKKQTNNYEIFNICNGKPLKLMDVISFLKKLTGHKKIKLKKKNNSEVFKTFGANNKIIRLYKNRFIFSNFKKNVIQIAKWYKEYNYLIN
jgi:UDP-glucuronate 4-epimerase